MESIEPMEPIGPMEPTELMELVINYYKYILVALHWHHSQWSDANGVVLHSPQWKNVPTLVTDGGRVTDSAALPRHNVA
ncbi:hypothetical protein F8M41_009696 [Gigaspora margarita]|uniref:Uncharacterized protein n=1 Tax=Gigaspora margarita TaxID=4874 RepID=A0A8H4AV28_GIGMA|nr:hypothetical protein F8M41_009696 [Gigaspora margarita]